MFARGIKLPQVDLLEEMQKVHLLKGQRKPSSSNEIMHVTLGEVSTGIPLFPRSPETGHESNSPTIVP